MGKGNDTQNSTGQREGERVGDTREREEQSKQNGATKKEGSTVTGWMGGDEGKDDGWNSK